MPARATSSWPTAAFCSLLCGAEPGVRRGRRAPAVKRRAAGLSRLLQRVRNRSSRAPLATICRGDRWWRRTRSGICCTRKRPASPPTCSTGRASRLLADEGQRTLLRRILTASPPLPGDAGRQWQSGEREQPGAARWKTRACWGVSSSSGAKRPDGRSRGSKRSTRLRNNRSGFKCPHCGAGYLEEQLDQLLSTTDNGMRMAGPITGWRSPSCRFWRS